MTRKKTKKFRGSMTHGRGKKAGRGAGLRGGRGNAGLLKHKKMYAQKYMPNHFGKHGFKRPQSVKKEHKIINIGELEDKFPGKKEIDLTKEGYDKLLGAGSIENKVKIKVKYASEKAVEQVKEKGGEVVLPEVKEEGKKEQKADGKQVTEDKEPVETNEKTEKGK